MQTQYSRTKISALPLIAKAISHSMGVQVVMDDVSTAMTIGAQDTGNGRDLIVLPALKMGGTETEIAALEGYLDHEVGHVRYTDFKQTPTNVVQDKNKLAVVHKLWNTMEDPRIEGQIALAYPGCRRNLVRLTEILIDQGKLPVVTPDLLQQNPLGAIEMWLLHYGFWWHLEYPCVKVLAEDSEKTLRAFFPSSILDDIQAACRKAVTADSTKIVTEQAIKVYDLIQQLALSMPQQSASGQGQEGSTQGQAGNPSSGDPSSGQDSGTPPASGQSGTPQAGGQDSQSQSQTGQASSSEQAGQQAGQAKGSSQTAGTGAADAQGNTSENAQGQPSQSSSKPNDNQGDSSSAAASGQANEASAPQPGSVSSPEQEGKTASPAEAQAVRDKLKDQLAQAGNTPPSGKDRGSLALGIFAPGAVNSSQYPDGQPHGSQPRNGQDVYPDTPDDPKQQNPGGFAGGRGPNGVSYQYRTPRPERLSMLNAEGTTHRLRSRLERYLAAQAQSDEYCSEVGRNLVTRKLPYVQLGDAKVFSRVDEGKEFSTAVSMLIDVSGSMGRSTMEDSPMRNAIKAALAMGDVLESLTHLVDHGSLSWSVTGFDTLVYPTHRFSESWKIGRARVVGMDGSGGTTFAPALLHVSTRLQAQKEQRKLLILITDGEPYDVHDSQILVSSLLQLGIEVYALVIGKRIGTIAKVMAGSKMALISDVSKLPEAVTSILKHAVI